MLLDSNIVIGFSALEQEGDLIPFEKEILFASIVTKIEVLGFHKLKEIDRVKLEKIFGKINLIELSLDIADKAIELRRIKNISLGDSIVAATALIHNQPLVTANTSDFKWITGISLINPFQKK